MPSASSSNYLVDHQLDYLLKGTTFTRPTHCYVGLFTTTPALDNTGGVEVSTSGTAYSRLVIDSTTGWTGPSGANRTYSNAVDLTFAIPTANWGTIVSMGLFTALTGGNLLYVFSLVSPRSIILGDGAAVILQGQLTISRATC